MEKLFLFSLKVIIKDEAERCLLIKRSMSSRGNPGKWDFPGGKIDLGETFEQGLRREVREETGLEIALTGVAGATEAELPDRKVVYLIMEGRYLGGQVQLSEEHDDYVWTPLTELAAMDLGKQFCSVAQKYSAAAKEDHELSTRSH